MVLLNFDFAPKPDKDYLYNIKFSKIGYKDTSNSVDLYKIDQSFVILLEKNRKHSANCI